MQFTTPGLLDDDDGLRGALATVDGLDAEAVVARSTTPTSAGLRGRPGPLARGAGDADPRPGPPRRKRRAGPLHRSLGRLRAPRGRSLEVGGFQPFESYDTALANLDGSLERRPAPEDAATAVLEFPIGLTTAEIAAIMRPSDLEDADLPADRARTDRRRRRRRAGLHPARQRRPLAPRRRRRQPARLGPTPPAPPPDLG